MLSASLNKIFPSFVPVSGMMHVKELFPKESRVWLFKQPIKITSYDQILNEDKEQLKRSVEFLQMMYIKSGFLSRYLNGPLPYVWSHITVK